MKQFQTLLDYLELASREGGGSDWLERWKVACREKDLEKMAQIASAIGNNIGFTKQLVDKFVTDEFADEVKLHIFAALDAIAFEVYREAAHVLAGTFNPELAGRRTDALESTFRRVCDRTRTLAEVKEAVASLQIMDALPETHDMREFDSWRQTSRADFMTLEEAAQKMDEVVGAIKTGSDPGAEEQTDSATALDNALLKDELPSRESTS